MLYEFETILYQAEQLSKLNSIEEQPFEYKYRARKLLQQLLEKTTDNLQLAIIHYELGINFLDCEENGESRKNIAQSLNYFSKIENIDNYLVYIQSIYSLLGFLAVNLDENEIGLSILIKAEKLGEYIIQTKKQEKQIFKFQGGFYKVQEIYTITLFYIAQAYTKIGIKDKAAYYCGQTMQRQFKSKTYELKDFVINCISLSEYYSSIWNYSQAYYLLQIGESIIPLNKRKKLRATIQMAQAKVIQEMMDFCVTKIKNQESNNEILINLFNKKSLEFQDINIQPIQFKPSKTYDEIKSLFRQANTLYKRSMSIFVLDGFVTEHIQIISEISMMYKVIIQMEQDPKNIIAFQEKRLELLTPILNAINPKAYQNTYEKLLVEVADINNELYEFIYTFNEIDDSHYGINKKMTEKMNKHCKDTITYQQNIINQLKLLEEKQRDQAYYSSYVSANFNIAKALSKYFTLNKNEKVNNLVTSLKQYQQVIDYIVQQNQQDELKGVMNMCKEMISILPTKIDRVNYS